MTFNAAARTGNMYIYVHTMCVQTKKEMDAAEPKSGSCRFANLNKGLALQTSKECYRF